MLWKLRMMMRTEKLNKFFLHMLCIWLQSLYKRVVKTRIFACGQPFAGLSWSKKKISAPETQYRIRWTWGWDQHVGLHGSFSWDQGHCLFTSLFSNHLMMRTTRIAIRRRVSAAPERMPRKGVKWRGTVWDSTWGKVLDEFIILEERECCQVKVKVKVK